MTFRHFQKIRIHAIPAEARIHDAIAKIKMDPGLRRDDEQHAGFPEPLFDIEIDP